MTRARSDSPVTKDPVSSWVGRMLPGCVLCLAAAGVNYEINLFLPGVGVLITTIVLGVLLANVIHLPDALSPGIDSLAKKLLCAGVILLGFKLSLASIIDLGVPMLLVVVCIVTGRILGTVLPGRLLWVPPNLSLLIACGFSICGAAVVAGTVRITDPDDEAEEDTITTVALVAISGTLTIPLVPLVAGLLSLDVVAVGKWTGGSAHEITQVVAIGGVIGGEALAATVVVKLARVLLLAPVIMVLNFRQRQLRCSGMPGRQAPRTKPPPIVSPFILGFLAMMLLHPFVALPGTTLGAGETLQTLLLAATMFGLGYGVKIRNLLRVSLRPFGLTAASMLLVTVIVHVGVALAG